MVPATSASAAFGGFSLYGMEPELGPIGTR
jgi:hypothetical protein